MSVGVPIYRRILYGSFIMPDSEEKEVSLGQIESEQKFEHCQDLANPRALTADMLESTRHSLSALVTHVGGYIEGNYTVQDYIIRYVLLYN